MISCFSYYRFYILFTYFTGVALELFRVRFTAAMVPGAAVPGAAMGGPPVQSRNHS